MPGSRIRTEVNITKGRLHGSGRRAKPLSADYVLFYKDRPLAIIETKKRKLYYTDGNAQAKDYADRLGIRYCYSTNGERIYAIDLETGTEGEVFEYPSPEALWAKTFPHVVSAEGVEIEEWKLRFDVVPIEDTMGRTILPFTTLSVLTPISRILPGTELQGRNWLFPTG